MKMHCEGEYEIKKMIIHIKKELDRLLVMVERMIQKKGF